MTGLIIGAAIVGFAAALVVFLLGPGHARSAAKAPFAGRNIAHRGLFEKDQSVPENSLAAFRLAADAGYGIELDVQFSRDGEVVVFHDDALGRVCGVDSRVDALDFTELRALSLCQSDEHIPLFTEVLELVNGRVPIVVELKNGPRNKELCRRTMEILSSYQGDFCVESFNPFIVAWFRFHAPHVLRGQLSQPPKAYAGEGVSRLTGAILGRVLLDFIARPHFIAYRIGPKPLSVRFAEALGAMRFAWTAHDESAERDFDAVIFEHYRPETNFIQNHIKRRIIS